MGHITIKDDLVRELAAFAEEHGVSIDQQAESWLRESLRRHASGRKLKAIFAEIAAMSPEGVAQTDSVELLRELRDR